MAINQITNAAAVEQARSMLLQEFNVSSEFADKVLKSSLLLAGANRKKSKLRSISDFRLHTQFVEISKDEADMIHEQYCLLEEHPSQLMELTGAKIEIVRARIPGLYGLCGIMYQEAPDFIAVCDFSGRCHRVPKKHVDWICEGVYFIGKVRNSRYKRLKTYSL